MTVAPKIKRALVIVASLFVIFSVAAGCAEVEESPDEVAAVATDEQTTAEEQAAEEPEAEAPEAEEPKETVAQQNAREAAENYLSFSAFSRKGLIEQLKFEGYTQAQAEYGVRQVGL